MELTVLQTFFETSPAIRLFRSPNACFIIDFMYRTFKQGQGQISISHSDLLAALVRYCEDIHDVEQDSLSRKPEEYIAQWSSPENRWLDRKLGSSGQPEYQLSPHTETVLNYLNHNLNNELGFIGTESRLRFIIQTLTELVEKASDDPQIRLNSLKQKQKELNSEISNIEQNGAKVNMSDGQIREQFFLAISMLRTLQSDFRAVEEEFKNITRDVQAKQAKAFHTRGQILGHALDAEDVLRTNDQGVSFYEFFRFILSPSQQDALEATIEQLKEISALKGHDRPMDTLSQMVPLLAQEAQKIMRTNHRLTTTLRKLLDSRNIKQRQRISELLKEIQSLGMELAALEDIDNLPDGIGISLELKADIESPWRYSFWTAPEEFQIPEVSTFQADSDQQKKAFDMLAQMKRINWDKLKSNINDVIAKQGSVTLKDLIAQYPLESGAVEVLCYLQLATEQNHIVSATAKEEICIMNNNRKQPELVLTIPLVRFVKQKKGG